MSKKVLLVDDEPNILQAFKRHLRNRYELELAVGPQAAMEAIKTQGPFAVVVSDMQMPEVSGVELLRWVREQNDQTTRVMLTGNADQKTAVDAVNEGHIFRFLTKPCPPEMLASTLDAAIEQYRLVTVEAELLSKTLSGSVRMLTQILAMALPEAFGLSQEARQLCRGIAQKVNAQPLWQIEMAAMLMRVGCVSLPADTLQRFLRNERLSAEESKLVHDSAATGAGLIASIPRLEGVAQLVREQNVSPKGEAALAARVLRTVSDFQRIRGARSPLDALSAMQQTAAYDPALMAALEEEIRANCDVRSVCVHELCHGAILEANVEDLAGRVLLAKGTELQAPQIERLERLKASGSGVREPITVRVHRNLTQQGS